MIARLRVRDLIGMDDRRFALLVKPLDKPKVEPKPKRLRTINIEIVEPLRSEELVEADTL